MNPILVPIFSCRSNWSLTFRCSLIVAGVILLLAVGSAGAAESFRQERVMTP